MNTPRINLKRARKAAGYTQETFAYALEVDPRTVKRWENGVWAPSPARRSEIARLLGISLSELEMLLADAEPVGSENEQRPYVSTVDCESWSDDLDRAIVHFGRQDFPGATMLVDRWLRRFLPDSNDTCGMSLYARSLRLQGDLRQDQGLLRGPLSARQSYSLAREIFTELGMHRRVAQIDLQLAVNEEMTGAHRRAAEKYFDLADDVRLSGRDRARSRLWVGTALSKADDPEQAIQFIEPAIIEFDRLEEPLDWSTAHQKLALAHRSAGDLQRATAAISVALDAHGSGTPMQQVRLDTAYSHILLSDPRTETAGHRRLEDAADVARQYGMMHQLQSIRSLRLAQEG
ncbi:helix-turn-helix domain-containing protein [Amycolatopsis echigonensis]|uniref:Helix-turn-helix transcriptional regulator n=1 Tax=Amycolatopsis echigonensis TaxID=2576905 RepID=A0A8E1VUD8_9PSEU|nr:helix-turn-helix transcriptional regulator [Amycolatopsis echigonensis]MBB2498487.1 helix-turn-helix transcriptional regulator [Amycolatopsis echigonensis]